MTTFSSASSSVNNANIQINARKLWLSLASVFVGWIIAMLGLAWSASSSYTALAHRVESTAATVTDHESRLRAIEAQVNQIATDVSWIRRRIEEGNRLHDGAGH